MTSTEAIHTVLRCYPKIYFACHLRHVKDERTSKVLSAHQASILDHLDGVEPTGVHRLAQHMGVTASTMSLNLDRLEAAGYVSRIRDKEDARRVQVRLTKAGVRIKQQQKVLDPHLIGDMLRQLSADEMRRAIDGLELLGMAANRLLDKGKARA